MKQFDVDESLKVDVDYEADWMPPSVRQFRPLVFRDGDGLTAALGSDPQTGIFGSGATAEEALQDWDQHFRQWQQGEEKDPELQTFVQDTLDASVKKLTNFHACAHLP